MREGGYFKQTSFYYPDQLDKVLDHLEEANKWGDIYFCPHLFKEPRRQKDAVEDISVLWVDKDKGKLDDIKPNPTLLWQTSRGKYQAIWELNKYYDPKRVEKINQYMTYKTKSDSGGWHLGKFLRLPESLNHKYDPPQEGKLRVKNGPQYQIEDLEPSMNEMKELIEEQKGPEQADMPDSLPPLEQVFLQYGKDIPAIAWKIMHSEPKPGDDWSANLWRLERILREAGLPLEATYQVVKHSPWNKYERDNRSEKELWRDVVKAYRYGSPEEFQDKGMSWSNISDLLIYQEQPEWLVEGIWMDKNVGWIAGVGKSYKTVMSLDLALSVASGKPFLGKFDVKKPGPVLLIQEEDPKWRVAHRIRMMADQKKITDIQANFMPNKLVVEYGGLNVPLYAAVGQGFLFEDEEKVQAMEEAIEDYQPRMVIFDPLFMLTPGFDEYKSGEITRVLNQLKYWRNKYGCSIAIVHHYNKDSQGDYTQRLYGSMAMYAWSENSLFVTKQRDSNISVIQRDIKDALVKEQIAVEFLDLEDRYDIEVREDLAVKEGFDSSSNKGKVVQYLMNHSPGTRITFKQLKQALNIGDRSLRDIVAELEDEDCIIKERKGQGGKSVITTTTVLFDEYGERGLDLKW